MKTAFDPRRLTRARQLKKFSKKQLAQAVGVSASSITQYESGRTVPPDETRVRLALACGVPTAYFDREPDRRRPDLTALSYFRSLRSTSQTERDAADATAEHVMDVTQALDKFVRLPDAELPAISPLSGSRKEVETIAQRVRKEWNVAPGPVPHMVRLLESRGIVVARLHSLSEESRLDAFSRWFEDRPLVLLWSDKGDKARSRFDAAHELGHLVMHQDESSITVDHERQADYFASSFLMPMPEIQIDLIREAPTARDWQAVFDRRAHWGVSAKALLYRSRVLGALPEFAFRRAMQNYNRHEIGPNDGAALGEPEKVKLLSAAAGAAGLSTEAIADMTYLPESFVTEVLGEEPARNNTSNNVVALRASG